MSQSGLRFTMHGLWMSGLAALVGCTAKSPEPALGSDLPASRIAAIHQTAEQGDTTRLAQLIEELASDDPAVRMYAIAALEKLTGQRLGYLPHAPMAQRQQAIARWVGWYHARHKDTTENAS